MEASGPWLHPPHPASCMEPGGTLSARPPRWLGTPVPGSGRLRAAPVTDHGPQPSDYGAQTRAACMAGPAGLRQGRGPFLSARPTGRQAAGGSRGPGTGAELASIFPSSCHAGQGPSGPEVAFPGEETAQRGGVPGRVPWPGPQGCCLLCGRRPTRVVLRVNHLDRDLQLYPADTPRPGARKKPGQAPGSRPLGRKAKSPRLVECLLRAGHTGNVTLQGRGVGGGGLYLFQRWTETVRTLWWLHRWHG